MTSIGKAWMDCRLALLERLLMRMLARSRKQMPEHLFAGLRGELAAYFYLRRMGWTVVARNWRSHVARGDLDLIAWEGQTLCFVEVKARTQRDFASPESAVDEDKRRNLRRLARRYLKQAGQTDVDFRFDVLSIYLENEKGTAFELFRGAFA